MLAAMRSNDLPILASSNSRIRASTPAALLSSQSAQAAAPAMIPASQRTWRTELPKRKRLSPRFFRSARACCFVRSTAWLYHAARLTAKARVDRWMPACTRLISLVAAGFYDGQVPVSHVTKGAREHGCLRELRVTGCSSATWNTRDFHCPIRQHRRLP